MLPQYLQEFIVKAEVLKLVGALFLCEDSDERPFTVDCREGSNPQVDTLRRLLPLYPSLLRNVGSLRQKLTEDLDARNKLALDVPGERGRVIQDARKPKANDERIRLGLDVDVARAEVDTAFEDAVREGNDIGGILTLKGLHFSLEVCKTTHAAKP
jgi:hypothetical protein